MTEVEKKDETSTWLMCILTVIPIVLCMCVCGVWTLLDILCTRIYRVAVVVYYSDSGTVLFRRFTHCAGCCMEYCELPVWLL